jgi:hypothetical protein
MQTTEVELKAGYLLKKANTDRKPEKDELAGYPSRLQHRQESTGFAVYQARLGVSTTCTARALQMTNAN